MSLHNLENYKSHIEEYGFAVINNVFSQKELEDMNLVLKNIDTSKENFRKTEDLFAIRQFLKEVPKIKDLVLNDNIQKVVKKVFGEKYFVVKSIYFDKPEISNWYVAYHQDLTISVNAPFEFSKGAFFIAGRWMPEEGSF